jgi:hypothetical protein
MSAKSVRREVDCRLARVGTYGRSRRARQSSRLWDECEARVLLSFSISDVTVTKPSSGTIDAVFTVTSIPPDLEHTLTVDYSTSPGTATPNVDYTPVSGTLTFLPGDDSNTISVPIIGSAAFDATETFTVNLSNPVGTSISQGTATGTIQSNNPAPTLAINNVSLPDGSSGTTNAVFTVTLTGPTDLPATVHFTTADGTAKSPTDYHTTSGDLTFQPGQTEQTISVPVVGRTVYEPDKTFTVNLTNPTNATISQGTGTGTILNDDPPPTLSIDNVSQADGSSGTTNFVFHVTLTGATEFTTTVDFATANGTAVSPTDYHAQSGQLTFQPGESTQTIVVPVVGTQVFEPSKTFSVNLSSPVNATIAQGRGTGTILNDDPPPTLSINDVSLLDGHAGTTNAVFTVTLTGATALPAVVNFATAAGTAIPNTDFTPVFGKLTFQPGQTTQTISVPVFGTTEFEPSKTFSVILSAPSGATIARGTGTGTIIYDNPEPSLSIDDVSVAPETTGTDSAVFVVTLSGPSAFTTTVAYKTANGSAHAGTEFTAESGTLTFAPLQTTATFSVPILPTQIVKPIEAFTVSLSQPNHALIARGSGTGTIIDPEVGGTLGYSVSSYTVNELAGQATITVTRDHGAAGGVTVQYATGNGTAVPGVDYMPASGTLTFGPDVTSATFTVPVLHDFALEGPRTVPLTLSAPGGGAILGDDPTATLTILDADSLVVVNTQDDGIGSLRDTILTANATPGFNTITFAIPGTGPFTISPLTPLPNVTEAVSIDATTQPGYPGHPIVAVDGTNAGPSANGLVLLAGNSAVRGLAIGNFSDSGILIQGGSGNQIQGDYLGTDVSGTLPEGNGSDGVSIVNSSNNLVGGPNAGTGNLLSGNSLVGVRVMGTSSANNQILGNLIGTNATGTARVPNHFGGVFIDGSPHNTIGGLAAGDGNLISGNTGSGVVMDETTAVGNFVVGNRIGVNASGAGALGYSGDGIFLQGVPGTTIVGNVIAANGLTGVRLQDGDSSGNVLLGNFIGTNAAGTHALANAFDGIFLSDAPNNTIGGTAPGSMNLISGNQSVGIQIFGQGSSGNVVQGNFVGTDITGTKRLGNGMDGVFVNQAPNNTIGGSVPGAGNLISANQSVGLQIFGMGSAGNIVQGNMIGTNVSGAPRLGNQFGLFLNVAGPNTLGGPTPAERNLIAGNAVNIRVTVAPASPVGTLRGHAANTPHSRHRVATHSVTPRGPVAHIKTVSARTHRNGR